jgi:YggT family protein
MSDTIRAALLFLVNTVFDLYLFILIIRIILAWVGADYFNPITQLVVKLTQFPIKPLRRYVPNFRGLESATAIWILVIEIIKFLLISLLSFGVPNIVGLVILAIGDTLKLLIETFFYAILLQAILSWIQPTSPINRVLYQFTSPIMRPLQRIIPTIGGFDISPIPALIILQFLIIILVNPLMALGLGVAFG